MKLSGSLALLALAACSAPTGTVGDGYAEVLHTMPGPPSKLDVLFVVDDSGSIADDQVELVAAARSELFPQLQTTDGSLPSLHVGVVSTSVNVPGSEVVRCDQAGLQLADGRLLVGTWGTRCPGITGNYLSDEPDAAGGRTTNFTGTLEDNFACIAQIGYNGCGIEQPLEAMREALDGSHPENAGFLRDDAMLLVVFLGDEDDSSVVDGKMWRGDATDAFSANDREFEYGVRCDPDDTSAGPRSHCAPRDNPSVIHGVGEYVDFLTSLKSDPAMVMVAGITSPPGPVSVSVGMYDKPGQLALDGACTPPPGPCVQDPTQTCPRSAVLPAVRLDAFIRHFHSRYVLTSLCDDDMDARVHQIARSVTGVLTGDDCLLGTPQIAARSCYANDVGPDGARTRMPVTLSTDATACAYTPTHLRASLEVLPPDHHAEVFCSQ